MNIWSHSCMKQPRYERIHCTIRYAIRFDRGCQWVSAVFWRNLQLTSWTGLMRVNSCFNWSNRTQPFSVWSRWGRSIEDYWPLHLQTTSSGSILHALRSNSMRLEKVEYTNDSILWGGFCCSGSMTPTLFDKRLMNFNWNQNSTWSNFKWHSLNLNKKLRERKH